MALKHKKLIDTEPILTRAVSLLPYSEKALNEYVNSLFEITLPISGKNWMSFIKRRKERFVLMRIGGWFSELAVRFLPRFQRNGEI